MIGGVRFVNIDGIVDHHCLKFLFIPPLVERGLYCNHLVRPSVHTFVKDVSAATGRTDFIFDT